MTTRTLPLVGAHFRPPAKALLQVLPSAFKGLRLRAEPSNPYDPNAVQVVLVTDEIPHELAERIEEKTLPFGFDKEAIYAQAEWHLGYIPRTEAIHVQPALKGDLPCSLGFDEAGKPTVTFDL